MSYKLIAINSDAKTKKSNAASDEFVTAIMYMRPDDIICAMAETAQCKAPCLNTSGRGGMNSVQSARQRKTDLYHADPVAFVDMLAADITVALRRAKKNGKRLAMRLNGTSDIPWENKRGSNGMTLMEMFPEVQFYDYTKLPGRKVPANYHLTVSYSGANEKYADKVRKTHHNVAVVFRSAETMPEYYMGRRVINGDETDMRFTDPAGVVVGLYAKGKAKKDTSGFVVDVTADTIAVM